MKSMAEAFLELPGPEQELFLSRMGDNAPGLPFRWDFWARPNQLPPAGDWVTWLLQAGRGFGKTRVGSEWVRGEVEAGRRGRLALVARTAADARDVMVEGESGILAISPPWNRPKYEPSKRRLTWPNGALATLYSADEPDLLRGPQHDGAWVDELAAWRFPDAWDQLMFGLRLGDDPRVVVTTTPRPTRLIRELAKSPTTRVTRGRSSDNRANLPAVFFDKIIEKYQGTRLGRQELDGEILEDNPGALWQRKNIDDNRITKLPDIRRIVVAADPAVTSNADSDETGIIVAGMDGQSPAHFYILDDLSLSASPDSWARVLVLAYLRQKADRIIGEVNNGGDLIETIIRHVEIEGKPVGLSASYKSVHATRGKAIRAEPISALYEQNRVHHVGAFPQLEDQLCDWDPSTSMDSPDRLDALVWALTELSGDPAGPIRINPELTNRMKIMAPARRGWR
jgi:phage terminase large subunit-like protein